MIRRALLASMASLAALLVAAGTAWAAETFTVTNLNDDGAGSFREALAGADEAVLDDGVEATVEFAPGLAGTIELESALPDLAWPSSTGPQTPTISIEGPGAAVLTIRRADDASEFRLFRLMPHRSLVVTGLTLENGVSPSSSGGAFLNDGSELTVTDSVLRDNRASSGGAVSTVGSSQTSIRDSVLEGNTATTSGGSIRNGAQLFLERTTIEGSTAAHSGGAILSGGGHLSIVSSTVAANAADGTHPSPSSGIGGGILVEGGEVVVVNSTVTGNEAAATAGGIHLAGAIHGPRIISNVTLAGNAAPTASNLRIEEGAVDVLSTIVSGPAGGGANCEVQGALISQGWNLESSDTCTFHPGANLIHTDPLLEPLADNGGPTRTMALQPGSPAIDQGLFTGTPGVDQRGEPRPADHPFPNSVVAPFGWGDDVGAFELQLGEVPSGFVWPEHPGQGVDPNASDPDPADPADPADPSTPGGPQASEPDAAPDTEVRVGLPGKRLRMNRRGVIRARVACPASEASPPCEGAVGVRTQRRVPVGKGGKRKRVRLGRGRFEAGAGETVVVRMRLNRRAVQLVRGVPQARRVETVARVDDQAGNRARVGKRMRLGVRR